MALNKLSQRVVSHIRALPPFAKEALLDGLFAGLKAGWTALPSGLALGGWAGVALIGVAMAKAAGVAAVLVVAKRWLLPELRRRFEPAARRVRAKLSPISRRRALPSVERR